VRHGRSSAVIVPTVLLVMVGVILSGGAFASRSRHEGAGHWQRRPGRAAGSQPANQPTATRPAATQPAATQPAANQPAVPNPNCTLVVPPDPLTAAGLATPYQLMATDAAKGPCAETNGAQSAFVQGAIISPAGQVTLYDPLVITAGTIPAAAPAPANVPAGSTVAVWFGFNGTNLTLANAPGTTSLQQGNCVNGLPNSIFGQFASCNGQNFFAAANTATANGQLTVPPLGTAKDGLPCPTVRDFSLVDQDQSDNVTTHYLANANGQTAQNNAAGRVAVPNAVDLANGSDNRLLTAFVLPTLGCTPFALPNGASDATPTPSLALDELQAAAFQAAPVALLPQNDPMTQVNAMADVNKLNLYRLQVDQPPAGAPAAGELTPNDLAGDGAAYCANLFTSAKGIVRVFNDMAILANGTSPDAAAATNLFTFLAMRGNMSFTNLNCTNLLNQPNPIALTMNNNIVTAATFTPAPNTPAAAALIPQAKPPAGNTGGGTTPAKAAIVGAGSGRCLDLPNGNTANGSRPQLADCTASSTQRWTATSGQQLTLSGNTCLDAFDHRTGQGFSQSTGPGPGPGTGTGNGTKVIAWDCNGQASQQWNINPNGTITGVQSGLCLDAKNAGTANGTKIILWSCHGGANQQWTLRPAP
jgi:hypothetical protein